MFGLNYKINEIEKWKRDYVNVFSVNLIVYEIFFELNVVSFFFVYIEFFF